MDKLIRNIPHEAVEELERRASDIGLKFGAYARLILIHAAARQDRSVIKTWATEQHAVSADFEKPVALTEQDRYQNAVDTGTLEYYYEGLRRDAFRRDEEREGE